MTRILTGACIVSLVLWHARVTGSVDLGAVAFFAGLVAVMVMAGRIVSRRLAAADAEAEAGDFPTTLLFGWLAVQVGLLLVKSLPLAPPLAAVGLAIAVVIAFVRTGCWNSGGGRDSGWSVAATVLSLVAATLWSETALDPVRVGADTVLFRPWSDVFYHSTWISAFAQAHGIWSVGHNLWNGAGLEFYSFGDYLLPSTAVSLTATTAFQATNCLWTPFGIFLTGIAAFALVRGWWGERAAFGAVVAVLLVPDASYYCTQNEYLGYFWLNEISCGGAYGSAAAAAVLIAVAHWCRTGSRFAAALAMTGVAMTFLVKVQICMALVPLVVVMAVSGRRRWPRRRRMLLLAGLGMLALISPWLVEVLMPGLGLRLDGSGAKPYLLSLVGQHLGALRWLAECITASSPYWSDVTVGVPFLLLSTFGPGLLLIVAVGLLQQWRARTLGQASLVVTAVAAIYLVMTLGLSVNETGKHTADALVHRPFVWAYFVIAAWAGGVAVTVLDRRRWTGRHPRAVRAVGVGLVTLLLVFVFVTGRGQLGPSWRHHFMDQEVDRGLVDCAEWLRSNSAADAIVQDSRQDPLLALVGLSERRCYLASSDLVAKALPDREQRVARLAALRAATDAAAIAAGAAGLGIDCFLLHPGDAVSWPRDFLDRPEHRDGGYAVYRMR
ncbi:MAG: hypothetical protein KDC98_23915 [Planctomycetes bacterium]|nr:hypothetical protein [Planctomycetota bacterium]